MEEKPKVYRLTIVKKEPNPNFVKELEEFEKNNRGMNMRHGDLMVYPEKDIATTALVVELTEAQFNSVKFNVLKAFE